MIGGGPDVTLENGDDKIDVTLDGSCFELDVNIRDWTPGQYYFVFNPGTRYTHPFTVDNPLEDFDPENEIVDCYQDDETECEISTGGDQPFTAKTSADPKRDHTARIGLRLPDGDTVDAVSNACTDEDLLADGKRLAGTVAHLLPVGFEGGGDITVTTTIPRSIINSDVNRGNPAFQICIAPELTDVGAYEAQGYTFEKTEGEYKTIDIEGDGPDLVGPILLDDCEDDDQTACVESRQRVRGADLVITYRIPTVDPWMM